MASSTANSDRSDFGSACTTVTCGDGGATVRLAQYPGGETALVDRLDDDVRDRARAVTEIEFFTDANAPDAGGVETLVTVDDDEIADLGDPVDVEQRATHRLRMPPSDR